VRVRCAYPRKRSQICILFFCKLQRVRERKPKKAKTKPLLPCCELQSRKGHHRQTPRPVGLTPAAAAALSPSSHSVTTPDTQTGSAVPGVSDLVIFFFFFSFPLLFCSYLLLVSCYLLTLLIC
jgi:hypothetical protein